MAGHSEPTSGHRADTVRFREVMSTVPSGVAVVTAIDGDEPIGLVVAGLLMVSVEPPLVSFLPGISSTSFPRVRRVGTFCANVLTVDQSEIANTFAKTGADKFAGLSWRAAPATGSPVLEGVAAWIDCRITAVHEAGDHFVVIAQAADFDAAPASSPLLRHRDRYASLKSDASESAATTSST